MMKGIVVIGSGGHARVLIAALKALGRVAIGLLDSDETRIGRSVDGVVIIGNDDKLREYSPDKVEVVNGIGSVASTEKRKGLYERFKREGFTFAEVIHPSATIADGVSLGEGVQVMAGAVIQTGCSIGNNAIINTGAVLDHGCVIGEHVHVAPGAVLSGDVHVGVMAHIGTSATIIQGIKIGRAATIGAGAVVITDMPSGIRAVGVPARIIGRSE
jgi:sugar O-acyltransferase (sialic acid O-acetyltransferase NeuD family)